MWASVDSAVFSLDSRDSRGDDFYSSAPSSSPSPASSFDLGGALGTTNTNANANANASSLFTDKRTGAVQRRADAYEAAAAAKEGGAGSDPSSSSSSSPAPPLTGPARQGSRAHENSPFPELRLSGSGSEGEEEWGGEGHSLALSDSASDASSVPPRPSSSRHK